MNIKSRRVIEKSIRDVMADISHKPNIDPNKLTDNQIKGMDLDPEEIEELLKLEHIYRELEDDKQIDPKHIAEELEGVIHDIRKSVEQSRIDAEEDNEDGKLRNIVLNIPAGKEGLTG